MAADHGCRGLEIRTHPGEQVHIGLSHREVDRVRAEVVEEGLEIACLAGCARVCAPGPHEPVVAELRALIDLAHRIGEEAVRLVEPFGAPDLVAAVGRAAPVVARRGARGRGRCWGSTSTASR